MKGIDDFTPEDWERIERAIRLAEKEIGDKFYYPGGSEALIRDLREGKP